MFQGTYIYEALRMLEWNLLPLHEQQIYRFLVQHALESPRFYVADYKPLNMETYLAVSRSISISIVAV